MDQSRLSTHFAIGGFTDCEEKLSRRFQICDVVDVATGEVRRDGGHHIEVLKAQGLQGMRPLFAVRRLAETKEVRTPPPARFSLSQPPLGSAHEIWSSPRLLLHMVQRSRPQSRNQMLRTRGSIGCVCRSSGSTRPHTDAATTLRICILVEYSVTLAVLDFFCARKRRTPLKHPCDGKMKVSLFFK